MLHYALITAVRWVWSDVWVLVWLFFRIDKEPRMRAYACGRCHLRTAQPLLIISRIINTVLHSLPPPLLCLPRAHEPAQTSLDRRPFIATHRKNAVPQRNRSYPWFRKDPPETCIWSMVGSISPGLFMSRHWQWILFNFICQSRNCFWGSIHQAPCLVSSCWVQRFLFMTFGLTSLRT